ncbi:helix-turn-helix transcriptional regulator [Streptomyces kaniharaensis]|uniref:Helix-turn-helix transcriptional regulator n=1 Tax=Streptomyces kaniharaensis TaxID=212423 RepID=A0A6N7L547_9ACTN|nr:helix-turn-helix transcriptional regulator [Streptomyces kaniharaensis]MQS17063.1 helix-turn-helix transcriptional regulator [Streptomyces kaniharaensis]
MAAASQQLAILRRTGLVTSRREGATVLYRLTTPEVADLLTVARSILGTLLTDRARLLDELRGEGGSTHPQL